MTGTPEPCVPGCFSDPPEPGWNDMSGDDIPVAPPLSHGRLQMVPCPEFVPENRPVFDPICTGTCDEANDLIPGCYDSGPYRVISDCELVDVVTCLGTGQIRMPSRWQIVGETPRISSSSGTLVWESGVLGLTPNCVKDEGETSMVIPVSRAPSSWSVTGTPCYDEYGIDQGPYEVVIPQIVDVVVARECGTPVSVVVPQLSPLTTNLLSPTVIVPQVLVPDTSTFNISSFSPSVTSQAIFTPQVAVVTTTTYSPETIVPTVIVPETTVLTTSTFPALLETPTLFIPGTADLSLGLLDVTIVIPQVVTPSVDSLTLTGFQALLSVPTVVTPDATDLDITTATPQVIAPVIAITQADALNLTGYMPSVDAPVAVVVLTLELEISPAVASVLSPATVVPDVTGLVLTTYPPTVIISGGGGGCDCEAATGVGGFIGEIQTTACTAECSGGECTYIWTAGGWVEIDRTCF